MHFVPVLVSVPDHLCFTRVILCTLCPRLCQFLMICISPDRCYCMHFVPVLVSVPDHLCFTRVILCTLCPCLC